MSKMIFNHIGKTYLSIGKDWSLPAFAPIKREYITIPGLPGGKQTQMETEMRRFSLPIVIHAKTFEDKESFLEDMAAWLIHKDPKPLLFSKYPNRTLYAQIEGAPDFSEIWRMGKGVLQVVCSDPYKYSAKETVLFNDGAARFLNEGTIPVFPVIRANVLQDITHIQVFDGERYFQIGEPNEIGKVIVPREQRVLNDAMASLIGWTTAGTKVDGGVVSGALETNGYSIGASSFGSVVTGWRGPAAKKSIPGGPLLDFKIRWKFLHKNPNASARGRMELYLFDDQSIDMGKFGMKRTGGGLYGNSIEARAGGESDYKYFANYAGQKGIEWRDFEGIMELSRVGNLWTVYTARIDPKTGKHTSRATFTHKDIQKKFVRNLAQIQLHIAQSGSNEPTEMRSNHIEVFRINPVTLEETPVIALAEDYIELNMKTKKIYVNGDLRADLKAFGSKFFSVPPGLNTLLLDPAGKLDASIEWEEGYL